MFKVRHWVLTALTVLLVATGGESSAREQVQHFKIESQSLMDALMLFSKQSKIVIVAPSELLRGKQAPMISGEMLPAAAIEKLLEGSGLSYRRGSDGQFMIVDGKVTNASPDAAQMGADIRMAAVALSDSSTSTSRQVAQAQDTSIEEIVVTAQKREERVQDVPVPVAVISGDSLLESNLLRLQDYYARVPALNYTTDFRGGPILSIRGISSGALQNPTIGIVIDDVPYGASTSFGGGFTAPDFDPSDLARIEVLRGPQGTLYGANSVGGLFKYVTVDPSTDKVSGHVQGGLSSVSKGDELGYNARAAINIPLSDSWAVRASGFTRRDAGYMDDPVQNLDAINRIDVSGGRLSALWRPSQDFSLKLGVLLQESKRYGSAESDLRPGLGDLEQNFLRGTGEYHAQTEHYTATVSAKLGKVDLKSLTGYTVSSWSDNPDFSATFWGGLSQAFFGVSGASLPEDNDTRKFSQEVRFSLPVGQKLEWLFGAFYTHEKTDWVQDIPAIDPATGVAVGSLLDFIFGPTLYEEYAVFTNLTFQVTEKFDVQIGGRQSHNRQEHDESGIFLGAPLPPTPTIRTDANAFTYSLTPRLRISPDVMLYARVASGYRVGGPNQLSGATGFPLDFKPDKTRNYELGVKGNVLGNALSYDVSAYYIDWTDLQVFVADPSTGLSGIINTGSAKSQGVELSVESRPLPGLSIAGWVAWNSAELTEDFPPGAGNGFSGDQLPYTSEFSGNLSLEQEFPLGSTMRGFAGASASYVDDRAGSFSTSTVKAANYPSYVQINLHGGLRFGSWTVNAFLNNAEDKRGILTGDPNVLTRVYYIQPRTLGLNVVKTF